jgi:hypothetical protein
MTLLARELDLFQAIGASTSSGFPLSRSASAHCPCRFDRGLKDRLSQDHPRSECAGGEERLKCRSPALRSMRPIRRNCSADFTRFHTYSRADAGLQYHPSDRTQWGERLTESPPRASNRVRMRNGHDDDATGSRPAALARVGRRSADARPEFPALPGNFRVDDAGGDQCQPPGGASRQG